MVETVGQPAAYTYVVQFHRALKCVKLHPISDRLSQICHNLCICPTAPHGRSFSNFPLYDTLCAAYKTYQPFVPLSSCFLQRVHMTCVRSGDKYHHHLKSQNLARKRQPGQQLFEKDGRQPAQNYLHLQRKGVGGTIEREKGGTHAPSSLDRVARSAVIGPFFSISRVRYLIRIPTRLSNSNQVLQPISESLGRINHHYPTLNSHTNTNHPHNHRQALVIITYIPSHGRPIVVFTNASCCIRTRPPLECCPISTMLYLITPPTPMGMLLPKGRVWVMQLQVRVADLLSRNQSIRG